MLLLSFTVRYRPLGTPVATYMSRVQCFNKGQNRSPQTEKENAMKKRSGFTLVEIMIVVAIIGLLAAIAIPSFVKARNTAQQNACINNLRQIDGGKEQAALEFKLTTGNTLPAASVNAYLKGGTTSGCPAGGTLTYGAIGTDPDCSISTPNSHVLPTGA